MRIKLNRSYPNRTEQNRNSLVESILWVAIYAHLDLVYFYWHRMRVQCRKSHAKCKKTIHASLV